MELIICIKMDLALNNLQRLICHKTHSEQQIFKLRRKDYSLYTGTISSSLQNIKKELETLKRILRIYNQIMGIEFGTENSEMLVIKSGKRKRIRENRVAIS